MPAEQPRKHHYLPQFYLKGFADKDGRLWQYAREDGKLVMVNVTKAGAEKDYHRLDVQDPKVDQFGAEKIMAEIEGTQAKVLRAVLVNPAAAEEHRVELLGLTQFMFYRVPKVRDMLVNATEATLVASTKVMEKNKAFDDMPEELKRHPGGRSLTEAFRIKPKNWYVVWQMLRLGTDRKLYELLYRRNLSVLVAKGFRRFITGDAAVAIYDRKHGSTPWKAAGFASATTEFSFPLSSNLLLLVSHESSPGVFNLNDDEVRDFNRRTIVWSERFLFAECFDSLTLHDIVVLSGRRAGFSTQNIEAVDGIYTINQMKPVHPALVAVDG
ncbi:DUF4238 domain-containing protein [Termitidicoccus mucosus]|uniref:DUF4238 domain-containing protein n=1 Tax=Termitidicoccus mucosus TaxID=1184151 RepID=A0A178IPU5_9BACT|nr:hypothetical protein AW736_04110 [Opitutaceae bacterium TSB47]